MWPHHYDCEYSPAEKRCNLNLWSPVNGNPQDVEDVAFSCYVKHQTELDFVINRIASGETSIDLDDSFSRSDLDYIANKLSQVYGMSGMLTLEG